MPGHPGVPPSLGAEWGRPAAGLAQRPLGSGPQDGNLAWTSARLQAPPVPSELPHGPLGLRSRDGSAFLCIGRDLRAGWGRRPSWGRG